MSWPQREDLDRLAHDMVAVAWLEGDFVLSSGRRSNHYFDKFLFETQPGILRRVGKQLAHLVPGGTQRLAAPELGAGLLGGAVSLELDLPLVIVRKQAKEHGARKLLEGLAPGETLQGKRVVILEDVTTTGGSSMKAIDAVRREGATVEHVVAVVDRLEGAAAAFKAQGILFHALLTAADFR